MKAKLLALMITAAAWPAFAGEIVFKGEAYPSWIVVQGVGKFSVREKQSPSKGGIARAYVDILGQIAKRERIFGRKIDVPQDLLLFIPADGTNSAQFILTTRDKIKEGFVVDLTPERKPKEGVFRAFHGKISESAKPFMKVHVFMVGSSRHYVFAARMFRPAFYFGKTQKKVEVVLYSPGYKLKVIDVELTEAQLKDGEAILEVGDDIALEPALYRVASIYLVNSKEALSKDAVIEQYYSGPDNGIYYFVVSVKDRDKRYLAYLNLMEGYFGSWDELELWNMSGRQPVYLGQRIAAKDLPLSLPRIKLLKDKVSFADAKEAPPAQALGDQKSVLNEKDVRIAKLIFFSLAILSSLYVFYLVIAANIRKTAERKNRNRHERESYLDRMFSLCGISYPQGRMVMDKALAVSRHKDLDDFTAGYLKKTIAQIELIFKRLSKSIEWQKEADLSLEKIKKLEQDGLSVMEKQLSGGCFDLARVNQERIEQLEEKCSMARSSIEHLSRETGEMKKAARDLVKMLDRLSERAQLSILGHSRDIYSMKEIQQSLDKIISEIDKEREKDVCVPRPDDVLFELEAKEEVERIGITQEEVDRMERFLAERKVRPS